VPGGKILLIVVLMCFRPLDADLILNPVGARAELLKLLNLLMYTAENKN
jgi:hypothetical protein